MAEVNPTISIRVDTSDSLRQIRGLQAQLSAFNDSVLRSSTQAVAAQKQFNSALMQSVLGTKAFSTSIVKTSTEVDTFTQKLEKNKLGFGEYFRYGASQIGLFRRTFTNEFDTIDRVATERVKKLQTQYISLGKDANGVARSMAIIPNELDMSNPNTQLQLAGQRTQIFNKLLTDGSTKLLNFGKNTQWAGRQLMVGFTLPLAAFGGIASKTFMDLETQATKFRRVYGDLFTTTEETNRNLKAVESLGLQYTKYGIQLSNTLDVAAQAAAAGMQNDKLMAGTEQTLRLATLGQIDYNQALEATISLQSAFLISSEQLGAEIDFLNAVENQTVLSLDDVTKAIPRAATVVKGLGGDVRDLAAFMAAMKEGGVSAEQGANAIKSGLGSLINPTNRAVETLGKLGINIKQITSENQGNLLATVQDFGKALDGLGSFERQQALETLFGKYQYARLGVLFQNINRQGSQAATVLQLAGSSAQDLASLSEKELGIISETTTAKFQAAVEKLKVAIAPLGEEFLKILTPIAEVVTKVANWFNELPDGVKKAVTIITVAVAGIGPIALMTFGLLANGIANIIKGLVSARNIFSKFFGVLTGSATNTEYLAMAELDAAAASASLEGKVETLTSSLLLQKDAVSDLIGLYGRLAKQAQVTAAAMPQGFGPPMMGPLTSLRRMATGGWVGGTGNKDSEPALLAPGEFVVNAKAAAKYGPILGAMNAGTLSGYVKGTPKSDTQLAHVGMGLPAVPGTDGEPAVNFVKANSAAQAIIDIAKELGKQISYVRNLVFEFSSKMNRYLANGKASLEEFGAEWDARGPSKWTKTLGQVGISFDEFKSEIALVDDAIKKAIIDIANARQEGVPKEKRKVSDIDIEKAYLKVRDELNEEATLLEKSGKITKEEADARRKVLIAMNRQYDTIVGVQATFSDADKKTMVASNKMEVTGNTTQLLKESLEDLKTSAERLTVKINGASVSIPGYGMGQSERALSNVRTETGIVQPYTSLGRKSLADTPSVAESSALSMAAGKNVRSGFLLGTGDLLQEVFQEYRSSPHPIIPKIAREDGIEYGAVFTRTAQAQMEKFRLDPSGLYVPTSSGAVSGSKRTGDKPKQTSAPAQPNQPHPASPQALYAGAALANLGNQTDDLTENLDDLRENVDNLSNNTDENAREMSSNTQQQKKQRRLMGNFGGKLFGLTMAVDAVAMGMHAFGVEIPTAVQGALVGLNAISMLGPLIPLLANPIGLLIAGVAGLAGLIFLAKKRLSDMFDEAVRNGKTFARSMQDLADSGKVYGKSVRDLSVNKIGLNTEQQSQAQEYFASEDGAKEIEKLSQLRTTLGREGFAEQFANDVALMAITQAWNADQIDGYISAVAKEFNDRKLYLTTRGTLAELLDPKNKEDILKNGLKIKVKTEGAGEFLSSQLTLTPQEQSKIIGKLKDIPKLLSPPAVQQRGVEQANKNADDYIAKQEKINELRDQMLSGMGDQVKLSQEIKLLQDEVANLMPGVVNAQNLNIAQQIEDGIPTIEDWKVTVTEATGAASIYGEKLFLGRQALAFWSDALDRGKISQERWAEETGKVNYQLNLVEQAAKDAISQVSGLENADDLLKGFRIGLGDQVFAGLDEQLKTQVVSALDSVSEETAIMLSVKYAQGSLSPQDIVDLTQYIEKLPEAYRTNISVFYGSGSLTFDNLQALTEQIDIVSQFDGKQMSYILNLGVVGKELFVAALQAIAATESMLGGATTISGGALTGAGMILSKAQEEADRIKKTMELLEGSGAKEPKPTPDEPTGGGSKKEKEKTDRDYFIEQLAKMKEETVQLSQSTNILNKATGNYSSQMLASFGPEAMRYLSNHSGELEKVIVQYRRLQEQKLVQHFRDQNVSMNETVRLTQLLPMYSQELIQEFKGLGDTTVLTGEQVQKYAADLLNLKRRQEELKSASEKLTEQIGAAGDVFRAQIEQINRLTIKPLEDQIKAIEETIANIEAAIASLEASKAPLEAQIEGLRKKEEEIQKLYDERVKALEQIERINEKIAAQQRGQLSIADALSQGDVSAAAAAAQQLQETLNQQDAEEMKLAVQADADNQREIIAQQIAAIETTIAGINAQIAAKQAEIAEEQRKILEKQKEIEKAKQKQLELEEKIYKLQLLQSMIDTAEKIRNAAELGRTDLVGLYQGQLGAQAQIAGGTAGGVTEFFKNLGLTPDTLKSTLANIFQMGMIDKEKLTQMIGQDAANSITAGLTSATSKPEITKPLSDTSSKLSGIAEKTKTAIDGVVTQFNEGKIGLKGAIVAIVGEMAKAITEGTISKTNVEPFNDALKTLSTQITTTVTSFTTNIGTAITQVVTAINSIATAIRSQSANGLSAIGSSIQSISGAISSIAPAVSAIGGAVGGVAGAIGGAGSAIQGWLNTALDQIATKLANALGQIGAAVANGIGAIGAAAAAAAAAAAQPVKKSEGGIIPGTGNKDTVPALLTPGEFVITKQAAEALGYGYLNSLNAGKIPTYQLPASQKTAKVYESSSTASGSVYNYSISVAPSNTANSTDVANIVMRKIKMSEKRTIKGNNY